MQKLGLQVTSFTRKSRKNNSYKGRVGTVAPNRIHRRFHTHIPHQKITTDTTEFKYYEVDSKGHMTMHKLYLDPFMDMYNGEILNFGIDKHPSAENVMGALEKAIVVTSDCPYRRTFHSNQGWAYLYFRDIITSVKINNTLLEDRNTDSEKIMKSIISRCCY